MPTGEIYISREDYYREVYWGFANLELVAQEEPEILTDNNYRTYININLVDRTYFDIHHHMADDVSSDIHSFFENAGYGFSSESCVEFVGSINEFMKLINSAKGIKFTRMHTCLEE